MSPGSEINKNFCGGSGSYFPPGCLTESAMTTEGERRPQDPTGLFESKRGREHASIHGPGLPDPGRLLISPILSSQAARSATDDSSLLLSQSSSFTSIASDPLRIDTSNPNTPLKHEPGNPDATTHDSSYLSSFKEHISPTPKKIKKDTPIIINVDYKADMAAHNLDSLLYRINSEERQRQRLMAYHRARTANPILQEQAIHFSGYTLFQSLSNWRRKDACETQTKDMLSMVNEWLSEVCTDLDSHSETYYKTIAYINYYLIKNNEFTRNYMQLIGITAVSLALKMQEAILYNMNLHVLAGYSDGEISVSDIATHEFLFLHEMDNNLQIQTPSSFLFFFISIASGLDNHNLAESTFYHVNFNIPTSTIVLYHRSITILNAASISTFFFMHDASILALAALWLVCCPIDTAQILKHIQNGDRKFKECKAWLTPFFRALVDEGLLDMSEAGAIRIAERIQNQYILKHYHIPDIIDILNKYKLI